VQEETNPVATVFIPAMMRSLTDGEERVEVPGSTLREVVAALDARYPGFADSVVQDGRVRPGLALAVNGVAQSTGLLAAVPADAEVHILPAISGGAHA